MREVILADGTIEPNRWPELDPPASGQGLVALAALAARAARTDGAPPPGVGVILDTTTEPAELDHAVLNAPLLAIRFEAFADGRGLSLAVLLRRAGYAGELHACGELLPDQLDALFRCGFDSVQLPERFDAAAAAQRVSSGTPRYQGSLRDPRPLYLRRLASAA